MTEGLVHPQLQHGGRTWLAYWGATIDDAVQEALDAIAAALPAVCTDAFDGDAHGLVHDLYACAVDQIARDRLHTAGVRLGRRLMRSRPSAPELLLDGLASTEPDLPPHAGLAALERRLTDWVDNGLERRSSAPWLLSLRLDEDTRDLSDDGSTVVLELWLQAADDPTLTLPVSLLDAGGDAVFGFLRSADPRAALHRQLGLIEPVLAEGGLAFDPADPSEDRADRRRRPVRAPARDPAPRGDRRAGAAAAELGLLVQPAARQPHRDEGRDVERPAHDRLPRPLRLEARDRRHDADGGELAELAAAKEPLIRVRGRWHALRHSDVERALRFLERRREGSVVDLVRAVSGIELEDIGLELGEVTLDDAARRAARRRRRPALRAARDARRDDPAALPLPGARARVAADARRPRHRRDPRRRHGAREDGAGDRDAPLRAAAVRARRVRADARRLPDERGAAVGPRDGPVRTVTARPCPPRRRAARRRELAEVARASDLVITSYDIATRDIDVLATVRWDRLLLDEAQDVKNPATKRARALRRLDARRRLAMTGTPIENRLDELWAIMDIVNPGLLGSRERFQRTFARPIEAYGDESALERLRAMVQPFILRRPKDSPEVELELPKITITKEYCRLTLEQASLYRATVDRWMPRIEEHERSFGRRGAVLAMLSQLKQVCNHPEMVLPTGRPLAGRSGKLERLVELLEAMPADDKALVFTQYPGFDRIVPHLHERLGREIGFFHGGLAARQRDELVASFAEPEGPSVLVISIRAGGRGLNLPAANHVFHFDRWWNPAVEQQATDRAYRFGQHKDVFVHSLICTATLEERIDELLDSKRELAEKVVAGRADDWLGELDLDTIRAAVMLSDTAVEAA